MGTVITLNVVRQKAERAAKEACWEADEKRLRFMIQGDPIEGIYLNMLNEYGPSMAHTIEEKFRERAASNVTG